MKAFVFWQMLFLFMIPNTVFAQQLIFKATADIWLSDATQKERDSSSGKAKRFKLKSIQEMAVVRFNVSEINGYEVKSARLFLYPLKHKKNLKYLRVSTVNQDWKEGISKREYGTASGATYNFADVDTHKNWAWEGSEFCDVSFGSGNSFSFWGKVIHENNGWVSINIDPDLIYALAVGDSDGLALQEGGSPGFYNYFIASSESGKHAPYLLIDVGEKLQIVPEIPIVSIQPDAAHSNRQKGALKIHIEPSEKAFCWKISMNKRPVDRWQIKHPDSGAGTEFIIDALNPLEQYQVDVTAVSRSGHKSPVKSFSAKASNQFIGEQIPKIDQMNLENQQAVNNGSMISISPGLVKIDPLKPVKEIQKLNSVWNGKNISLFGIRGEYVDMQLSFDMGEDIQIFTRGLDQALILETNKIWYSKTKAGEWQSAYTIPMKDDQVINNKNNERIPLQRNQSAYLDFYIKKDAEPGNYCGTLGIKNVVTQKEIQIPVNLTVYDRLMPDKLAFWPEMNAYHIPENVHDYYRLAHKHRCVANFWAFRPEAITDEEQVKLDWDDYDRIAGPLLSGEAFKDNPRKNVPVECMYLPFIDSWPTPLTKKTYDYQGYWPVKGDSKDYITQHYLDSKYIGDALSVEYKTNFLSVQQQFFDHFKEKGWVNTEMQFFFGGKNTHRTDYGVNMWWTTDEPYHWEDWLALSFFNTLWTNGKNTGTPPHGLWISRADISRPQWQGKILDGIVDKIYFSSFDQELQVKRTIQIHHNANICVHAYGNAGDQDQRNTKTLLKTINAWLNGADGFLPWQTIGNHRSLDQQESIDGNAIFVPGDRFGLSVVGDLRLKAFRNGEQFIEYLVMLREKLGISRQQIKLLLLNALGQDQDNHEIDHIELWQYNRLRKNILDILIENEN